MSAKNITTEKMNTSGFQSGGYKAPMDAGGGKHTPKKAIIDNRNKSDPAFPKGSVGAGSESKNNKFWKG